MKQIATAFAALAVLAFGAALAVDLPPAPVANPVKKMSLKACNKLADDKKLAGKPRAQYIKDCRTHNAPAESSTSSAPQEH
jgi:hypothetical protein